MKKHGLLRLPILDFSFQKPTTAVKSSRRLQTAGGLETCGSLSQHDSLISLAENVESANKDGSFRESQISSHAFGQSRLKFDCFDSLCRRPVRGIDLDDQCC